MATTPTAVPPQPTLTQATSTLARIAAVLGEPRARRLYARLADALEELERNGGNASVEFQGQAGGHGKKGHIANVIVIAPEVIPT